MLSFMICLCSFSYILNKDTLSWDCVLEFFRSLGMRPSLKIPPAWPWAAQNVWMEVGQVRLSPSKEKTLPVWFQESHMINRRNIRMRGEWGPVSWIVTFPLDAMSLYLGHVSRPARCVPAQGTFSNFPEGRNVFEENSQTGGI